MNKLYPTLIKCRNISLSYEQEKERKTRVLENIDFELKENEIIAIVGKSGAGKSSLLRVLAGLIKPSSGQLYYKEDLVTEPLKAMSMVFQNFALLPWLTVADNILFGNDALGISRSVSKPKALNIIRKIGLSGFENSYTSELSGGMKQRVGFARALMVEPEILLLDEPFSSLDIVTAKTLRNDIMDLWINKQTSTKAIVLVTHNIEEAVLMADRVIVLGSHPGRIAAEVVVDRKVPCNIEDADIRILINDIGSIMHAIH
ncbi:ABC transporter ATP-binding protein [Francisella frigiditurris]|uniref:ABC transporter family protein n=1 Tax=Francisella frigiditurris TaxID=1542390 RepID=A0A1J0KVK5_9GAMM|nr:ABC transporter ATP-binding protein [Francisella frigiditurris]APC97644.1 ABC transporter family protein [Francisella frigiditurris]